MGDHYLCPRHLCRHLPPLVLALALMPPGLQAQQDEAAFLAELPVVLSATRLKQSRHETPATVTVIDRHMIEASGARTLVDVLRLVPGMATGYYTGNRQVVSYHGMADENARRMQVLVDGRSVYQPDFGGVHWTSLPLVLEDIDRIEVIRGPNSVTHGTNSFLGVISILTRHAAEDHGSYTRLTAGNDSIGDLLLRHGGRQGNLDYRVSLQYQQDDGFSGLTRYISPSQDTLWDHHDWSRVRRLVGRADYQHSSTDRWEFQAGITESPQGMGTLYNDIADPPRTQHKENNFLQLRWERITTDHHDFHIQFHRDEHRTRDRVVIGPFDLPPSVVQGLIPFPIPDGSTLTAGAGFNGHLRTQRHDLEFQHRYSPHEGIRYVWGSSLRMDRVRSDGWFGRNDWLYHHLYRIFGNAEIPLSPRLDFNVGTMLERNSIIGHDLSPRLALNYRLAERHSLRAAWSRASRTPAMIEEYSDVSASVEAALTVPGFEDPFTLSDAEQLLLSSGGLHRERIESVEIGYFGEFLQGRLQLDVKAFHNEVDQLLTLVTEMKTEPYLISNRVIDFEPTDRARLKGVETQLDWRPSTHTMVRFGHAWIQIASTDAQEEYSSSAPRNSFLLFASHRFPRQLDASLAWHHTQPMRWLEWESIDTISRLDLRLAKGFRLGGQRAQVALVGQNVLGDHLEFRRGNRFDPRVFVQFSLAPG